MADKRDVEKWIECQKELREQMPQQEASVVFAAMQFEQYDAKSHYILFQVATKAHYKLLEEHYIPILWAVLSKHFGSDSRLKYRILELR